MDKKMEYQMETGLYRGLQGFGFVRLGGLFWGSLA